MKFSEIDQYCRQVIERGMRDSFKRSTRYNNCLKKARIEKPRLKKDKTLAKKPAVFYKCNQCQDLFKRDEIQIDHINPIIPVSLKLVDLTPTQLLTRIWLGATQVLCKPCHKIKSKFESAARRKFRKLKK